MSQTSSGPAKAPTKELFPIITGSHWKEALMRAKSQRNTVSEKIVLALFSLGKVSK